MKEVTLLHREAMALYEKALLNKARGDISLYNEFIEKAFVQEKQAVYEIEKNPVEPSRSILLRSAASMAIQCGAIREAEILISKALSGDPPSEIAEELRDILEDVNFKRHLELRGIELLERDEFQFSLSGESVGSGVANSNVFIERIKSVRSMIQRTAGRLAGIKFSDLDLSKSGVDTELYISVPRAASFAVSFKLGHPKQQKLPVFDRAPAIIDEMLECVDLFSKNNIDLKKKIADPIYYSNFVALVRSIAPDGQNIKLVGFTAYKGSEKRSVMLVKPKEEYTLKSYEIEDIDIKKPKMVRLQGTLLFADKASVRSHKIKIVDNKKMKHDVIVPLEMMDDIVKPMWGEEVIVIGEQKIDRRSSSPKIILKSIDKVLD